MNTHPGICISLLGRFCLYLGDQEIAASAFKSRKAFSLLKLLAVRSHHQLHRDQALDTLWAGLDPAAAAAQLYKAIHYLRKAFATSTAGIAPEQILVYKDEVLQLTAPGEVHTDVGAFQQLAREARRSEALALYQRAVACYAGDLLPADIYESWSEELRESLRTEFVELLAALGKKHTEAGSFADAADAFRRVLGIDPLDEAAHRGLMRAFALQGSRSQALHQYKRCEEILAKELEVKPAAATTALFQEIRDGKIQPAPPKALAAKPLAALHQRSPLIGRQNELKIVSAQINKLAQGRGGVLILQGAAGIGKTRFVQEIFHLAQQRGLGAMIGSAYEQEREMPYSPVIEALRAAISVSRELVHLIPAELAAGIPELQAVSPQPIPAEEAPAQSYLFAGLLRFLKALTESQPGGMALILEDLHFADDGTIKLFSYLARHAAELPLLLIGTCRVDQPEASPALQTLLAEMARARLSQMLALQPLSQTEHQQLLIQSLEKGEIDVALAGEIFSFTEGNPLFAVEMIDQLKKAGEITLQEGVWRAGAMAKPYLPPSLQILLAQKWNRLSTHAQALVNVVAVAGQQTSLNLLENILRMPSAEILEFQAIGVIYEVARSDLFRASVLMRRGQTKNYLEAGRLLTGALPTFVKLGAETMMAQARSAMKQMNAMPHLPGQS